MTNLRSWANRWQLANVREPKPSHRWPLVGMFAIGLAAGAIGSYAVTQRSHIKSLGRRALATRRGGLSEFGGVEVAKPVPVTSHRSNHRRRAAVEVT